MRALLGRESGRRVGVVEVAAKWPLAVDGLARVKCGGDELVMVRDLDRHRDYVDVWLGHEPLMVREHRGDPEQVAYGTGGLGTVRAECADLVVRQRAQCWDVGGGGPAAGGADADDPDANRRLRPCAVAGSDGALLLFRH